MNDARAAQQHRREADRRAAKPPAHRCILAARLGGPFQKTADDGEQFRLFEQEGVVALVGRDLGE